MKKLLFIGVVSAFALGSCNGNSHDHSHDGHDHESHEHTHSHDGHGNDGHSHSHGEANSDVITLSKAKAEAAGVKVSTVAPMPFRQVIKTSGQVLAAQGDEAVAVATVAGVVSFREAMADGKATSGKALTEGMSVGRGTPLLTISSAHIADGDPAQRARIAYETAKKEYERMQKLTESKIVSDKDFAQAKQTYEDARIGYEALAKNHSANGQRITSPIGGYVKSVLVSEGEYVTVGQPLVVVTQNRRLRLRAEVSEKYYSALRNIRSANFRTPYNNKVYDGGRLLSYGKAASGEGSFYIPVTFEFDNQDDIVPGAFVEVYLHTLPMENVLALPRTALTEEQGVFFVYLQLCKEEYTKQEVTLGADDGKNVQIVKGLKAGDRVVTEGAYAVKLASASNAIPAHSHDH